MIKKLTPETDDIARGNHVVPTEWAEQLELERDEARAVAYDLATLASHCLGWHDHETAEAAERISSVLQKWKQIKSHDIT